MVDFIHNNKIKYGVEAICTILPITPSTYYRHLDLAENPDKRSKRALHDEHYAKEIKRIWCDSSGRYGIRKVWEQLKKEGHCVARCRVARLMQKLDIQGVWRGKTKKPHEAKMIKDVQMIWLNVILQHNIPITFGWSISPIFRPIQVGCIRHLSLIRESQLFNSLKYKGHNPI